MGNQNFLILSCLSLYFSTNNPNSGTSGSCSGSGYGKIPVSQNSPNKEGFAETIKVVPGERAIKQIKTDGALVKWEFESLDKEDEVKNKIKSEENKNSVFLSEFLF
jgi:hypothetical protein